MFQHMVLYLSLDCSLNSVQTFTSNCDVVYSPSHNKGNRIRLSRAGRRWKRAHHSTNRLREQPGLVQHEVVTCPGDLYHLHTRSHIAL